MEESIGKVSLPDGVYAGTMTSNILVVISGEQGYEQGYFIETTIGVRGVDVPTTIRVESGLVYFENASATD